MITSYLEWPPPSMDVISVMRSEGCRADIDDEAAVEGGASCGLAMALRGLDTDPAGNEGIACTLPEGITCLWR